MENLFIICFGAIFYIGGPLLLFMGIYYLYLAIRNPNRVEESKNWPTTEGRISSLRLIGKKGMINNIELRYQYAVGGQEYTSKNLNLFPNTIFGKERVDEILEEYHEGQYVNVHYNPQKPKEAVLELDLGEQHKFFLIWSILNVVVGGFLVAVLLFGFLGN
jgi:hypothetical protein